MPKRLFILDANALLHRTWHAIRPLTNPEGLVVNCVYGMLMSVLKLIQEQKPDAFVACWDTEAPTFRHEAYEAYKANRVQKEDELYAQIPWIKEGFEALGIPSYALDGYEADDLIGTFANQAKKAGWEVVIVTGDRDALQLIQKNVSVMAFKKGVSETKMYDEASLLEEYGLTPEQFLEYKAMRGDPSDNIPGVRGIGEKGATELLKTYGNIKNILKAAKDKKSDMSEATREKLLAAEKELPGIIKLVTIDRAVPIKWKLEAGVFPKNRDALLAFLHRMGFRSLLSKIPGEALAETKKAKAKTKLTPSPKRATPTPSGAEFGAGREGVQDVANALKEFPVGEIVAVMVPVVPQGSLFGPDANGLVLATAKNSFQFTSETVKKEAKKFSAFLTDNDRLFVAHDAKSEMKGLRRIGLPLPVWTFDTMIASYLLGAGERNHDLDAIASKYLGVQLEQNESATRRASAVALLVPLLRKALKEEKLETIFSRFEMPLIPVLDAMEEAGIKIDTKYLAKLSKEMLADKRELEEKMQKAAGVPFNPASPIQLADVLFNTLKLPTKGIKRSKNGFSTAASELEKLAGQHPLIAMVEDYREVSKLLSTYVDVLPTLADEEGRVHTTYDQAVAATGRLSSNDPNLQNIPIRSELGRKIRRAFVAKPGYRLLSCDYSQIELRLVAFLAKDKNMLEAFRKGQDIHTATAAAIWGVRLEDVTKEQRNIAKAINFGLIFGQGPQGLSQTAGISFAEAKDFIAKYFEAYSGIKEYMSQTKALAHSLGYVETYFGRKRYLPEIDSMMHQLRAQAERMAINMPVQGTEADLIKLAMIELADALPKKFKRATMLLQVHDELVFEVPEDEVEEVAGFVKNIMEQAEKLDVPIVVETKQGLNWNDMEPVSAHQE
ncbi:MAG TPA: DNA polymerase I [Verrucomicrobiae bacterium]|nr:DNA polymerase I [Verrucomicrobiae bacterium]